MPSGRSVCVVAFTRAGDSGGAISTGIAVSAPEFTSQRSMQKTAPKEPTRARIDDDHVRCFLAGDRGCQPGAISYSPTAVRRFDVELGPHAGKQLLGSQAPVPGRHALGAVNRSRAVGNVGKHESRVKPVAELGGELQRTSPLIGVRDDADNGATHRFLLSSPGDLARRLPFQDRRPALSAHDLIGAGSLSANVRRPLSAGIVRFVGMTIHAQ